MSDALHMLGVAQSTSLQEIVSATVLLMLRLSGLFVFAPILSSPAIAPRIKAGLALAITLLLFPLVMTDPRALRAITVSTVTGELAVGFAFGLTLSMLNEMVLFASSLLGMQFSFSLVNLIDPISKVETPVLGQLLGWMTTLVLLSSGLHRTLLTAVLRSFTAVPVGTFMLSAKSAAAIAHMAAGIFLSGVQLASPVMAAALTVEVTVALVSRLAPALPSTIMSVPFKTLICHVVLLGSLAVWPGFLERHFESLLDGAEKVLTHG